MGQQKNGMYEDGRQMEHVWRPTNYAQADVIARRQTDSYSAVNTSKGPWKVNKSEITMEVGEWVQVPLGI